MRQAREPEASAADVRTSVADDLDSLSTQWAPAGAEVMIAPGDSGGPAFLWGPTGLEIAGVTSFVETGSRFGSQGFSVRVSSFDGWIDQQTERPYQLTVDLNRLSWGNDGWPDSIDVNFAGGVVIVSVNGRVVHQDSDLDVTSVRVIGSNDNDVFALLGASAQSPVTLEGGGGSNTFTVGSGNLDRIGGTVSVIGGFGFGTDRLVLRDEANSFPDAYTLANGSVRRFAFALNYGGIEQVTLNAGTGSNVVTVSGTSPFMSLTLDGGGGIDTLVGPGVANVWRLNLLAGTSSSVGSVVQPAFTFAAFETVRGGVGSDTFLVVNASPFAPGPMSIDGQGGTDLLDFSGYTNVMARGVTVNLAAGSSSVGGAIVNVENVTGTIYSDTITGNALANVLRGNGGNDLISGGDGVDTLFGDGGNDVLIGGRGADALFGGEGEDLLVGAELVGADRASVFAEWGSFWSLGRPYRERVLNLRGDASSPSFASRANGNAFLTPATVPDDGALDSLFGEGGLDWCFGDLTDAVARADGELSR